MNRKFAAVFIIPLISIGLYASSGWAQEKVTTRPKAAKILANKEDLDSLVRITQSAKPLEKQQFLERLASPDVAAKASLETSYMQLLEHSDPDVRGAAARACAKLKSIQAIPKLRGILKSVPKNRFGSEQTLNEQKLQEYKQEIPIAQALSDLDDLDAARDILNREMLAVEWENLLPKFGARILPPLVERARTSHVNPPAIQDSALRTIAAIQDKAAVPQLKILLTDRDPKVRNSAARALAGIDTPDAAASVEQAYSGLDAYGKLRFVQASHKRWNINKTLQYAKRFIDDPANGAPPKCEMIETIGATGNRAVIPLLEGVLKDSDDTLREAAACELAKITGKLYKYAENNTTRYLDRGCPAIQTLKQRHR